MDVAKDVGELKRKAKFLGEVESAGIGKAEDVRAGQANRACYAIAVFAETIEGRVSLYRQIHFGAGDQIVQVTRGHVVTLHGVN